jgi:TolB protein
MKDRDEIFEINIRDGKQYQLTNNLQVQDIPSWSTDGHFLTFTSYQDGYSQIYTMNAGGTDQHQITKDKNDKFCPIWSNDGNFILFLSSNSGNSDVYIMKADGSDPHRLTYIGAWYAFWLTPA